MDNIKKQCKNADLISKYGTFVGLIFLVIIFAILKDIFFTITNFINILYRLPAICIAAMGLCCVIITGSIDLSIGATVSAVAVIVTFLISVMKVNLWVAIISALLFGCLVGSINAFNILILGIPDFIATIAMTSILDGLVFWSTRGVTIWEGLGSNFFYIGQGTLGVLPVSVILMIFLVILYIFVTLRTKIGRYIYAIGDNVESAKYSGINVNKVKYFTFVLCGLSASIAGVVRVSQVGQGGPGIGNDILLTALASVYLSMTVFMKGEPNILGTFLGTFLIAVLGNGLTLLNVKYYLIDIIVGITIIGVVIIATNQRKRLQGG